jgi:hypothetical protein
MQLYNNCFLADVMVGVADLVGETLKWSSGCGFLKKRLREKEFTHVCAHAHTCTIGYAKKERDCLHRDLIPYTVIRTRGRRNFWVWIGDDCGRVRKLIQEFYPGGPVSAVCCWCLTAFALSWSSGGGALQEICSDQHHTRRKKEFMWCWSLGEWTVGATSFTHSHGRQNSTKQERIEVF